MTCTNRTTCPLFHEFDGHCCPEPMVCLYEEHPRPTRLPQPAAAQMTSHRLAGFALLAATLSVLFLYGAVRM
jgi:hypothetical protein